MSDREQFRKWLQDQAGESPYFAGTFWFVLSPLAEADLARLLAPSELRVRNAPWADWSASVTATGRVRSARATFYHLPFRSHNLHIFFSLEKPWLALRPIYKLLRRSQGKAHLFPIGHRLVKACVRLNPDCQFDQTHILRGISYPSRPNEGGADINLRPGNAAAFFARLEDEKRVLKLARMRAPAGEAGVCEFTVSRVGYISYHRGQATRLLDLILNRLPEAMTQSVRPFEQARDHFVSLRFAEPIFTAHGSYANVVAALAHLPRSSLALLHANPYFHATLTNYEDGGEFDVFLTEASTIHIQGRGEASPASFLRLHNNLAEFFRDAEVSLEKPPKFRLRDLLEGRV